ncbi:aminotransferase class I/II-fold pyridoxal phosphate-dependent enzyme [bacterium]|nr:aminotransferase class I/II-fold pyridoxal phosphate-dependent enzyme [bacterium]
MGQRYFRDELPAGDPFPVAAGNCTAKMDQNESPLDLPDELKKEISGQLLATPWTRYPQPQDYHEVKIEFAKALGVEPERMAITNGCDGAIQGIHFLSGGSGRKALCFAPTYPMLSHAAWLSGTHMTVKNIGPEYRISLDHFSDFNLILIANPNNPTGTMTPDSIIKTALKSGSMVFVDEAYFDFSNKTWIECEYPNLAIGRSCSKAMLAGIRLGALIADPKVINCYESLVTAPYHLSHLQLIVARFYKNILPYILTMVKTVISERKRLHEGLDKLGIRSYPSHTNFILFELSNAQSVFDRLLEKGIRIRNMTKILGLDSHLRVTVGTSEQNELFLKEVNQAVIGSIS